MDNQWKKKYREFAAEQDRKITFSKDGSITVISRKGGDKVTSTGVTLQDTLWINTFTVHGFFERVKSMLFVLDMWVDYARCHGLSAIRLDYTVYKPTSFKVNEVVLKEDLTFLLPSGFVSQEKPAKDVLPATPDATYPKEYDTHMYILQVDQYRSMSSLFHQLTSKLQDIKEIHPLLSYDMRTSRMASGFVDIFVEYLGFKGCLVIDFHAPAPEPLFSLFYKETILTTGTSQVIGDGIALFVEDIHQKQRIKNIFNPPFKHLSYLFRKFLSSFEMNARDDFAKEAMHYFVQKNIPYEQVELAAKEYPVLPAELKSGFFHQEYTVPFMDHILFFYQENHGETSHLRIFETEDELFAFYNGYMQERLKTLQQTKQQAMLSMKGATNGL